MRGQVLFYYGQEPDCFEQEFSKFGNCLRPSRLYDAGGGNVIIAALGVKGSEDVPMPGP